MMCDRKNSVLQKKDAHHIVVVEQRDAILAPHTSHMSRKSNTGSSNKMTKSSILGQLTFCHF